MKNIYVVIFLVIAACSSGLDYENAEGSVCIGDLKRDIIALSADSMEGRAPFTLGESRTLAYLQQRMVEIGLEPAFDGSYFQTVPMVAVTSTIPETLYLTTAKQRLCFTAGTDYVAWSPSVKESIELNSSELIFAGFGINAPEFGWNDFEGIDVKGKTILVIVNDPGFFSGDSTLFGGNRMTYYGRWRYKFEEAERQGAKACFIVHEDRAAGYPWSVVGIKNHNNELYLDSPALENPACLVTGWFSKDAAEKLFKALGTNYADAKERAYSRGFKAKPLQVAYSIAVKNTYRKSTSSNVAGILRGTEKPDELVVFTAHWDHLGVGVPVNGDSIYNGASDNAAAVAWMFSIAKAFNTLKTKPSRTVLFLSPTAEESGLLGSQFFVENSTYQTSKMLACINNDVILFLGKYNDVTVTGLGHSDLDLLLSEEAGRRDRYICADPNSENGMFFRSDQLPFLKAGVPSIFAKGYSHQAELGREKTQQLIDDYWRTTYHKPSDEYNPLIHKLDGLADDARLFFAVGYRLANAESYPKWYSSSEFFVNR